MNVYLTTSGKLNLVRFHSDSAIQLLVDTYLKDIHRQNVRENALKSAIKHTDACTR